MPMPNFFTSPYFVPEVGNWHLKPGAPKEVVDEFNDYMKNGSDIVEADEEETEVDE